MPRSSGHHVSSRRSVAPALGIAAFATGAAWCHARPLPIGKEAKTQVVRQHCRLCSRCSQAQLQSPCCFGGLQRRRLHTSGLARPIRHASSRSSDSVDNELLTLQTRRIKQALLCVCFVTLSAAGPILFDWVKCAHSGRFPFFVPALTFHAWAIAGLLGLSRACSRGRAGLHQLWQPDMIWRFFITTSLFTAGDMLSFMSIQNLDVGTFSLVGKALAIIATVLLSRLVLHKGQTPQQYCLVVAVALATVAFCRSEVEARQVASALSSQGSLRAASTGARNSLLGLTQRASAVCLTSLAAVLQERLLTKSPGIPFLVQQTWMSFGAMAMSLFTLLCMYRLPLSALTEGFTNWRVLVLLFSYVASGLTAGLMVKKLGAVAKALCVPIYLGGCYAYAVHTGSAVLSAEATLAWFSSTACILLYAVTKFSSAPAGSAVTSSQNGQGALERKCGESDISGGSAEPESSEWQRGVPLS